MEIEFWKIGLLCVAAFCAGFIDAIAGGGGLIQTPAGLVILAAQPVVSVIGSLKIPAFTGTASAISQYLKKLKPDMALLSVMATLAFFASFAGSEVLTLVSNRFMKPVLLVVLSLVAVYTYTKKDFGQQEHREVPERRQLMYACMVSLVIGFYDGFIGPGTGSFLILAFVSLFGFDFLKASLHAKLVNMATNLGSIVLFSIHGKIIWLIALPMAASNAAGGILGARLAIAKGNQFIRVLFLIIIMGTLIRFAYDVFLK
jgi:uncharacterized membrane protein YfcA